VWVSSRTEKTLKIWKEVGVNTSLLNNEVIQNCDIIFLAVKPDVLEEAIRTCKPQTLYKQDKLFISVIVGIPLNILKMVSKERQ
jgi:pyrroline-5-carboxylate reductase